VIVLDVYPARERDTMGVRAADLVAEMNHPDARHIAEIPEAAEHILDSAEADAVIITFSAGDGNQVGSHVLRKWAKR
jgi:UDP-N-acetylmuramate-alanine ligase